jgi:serine protease AprX
MPVDAEELSRWIFGTDDARRYTQDSPVLPDVWLAFAEAPNDRQELLLTPHADSTAAALAAALAEPLSEQLSAVGLAYSESYVVASLTFDELIRDVLPLSEWWSERLWPKGARNLGSWVRRNRASIADKLAPEDETKRRAGFHDQLAWFIGITGYIARQADDTTPEATESGGVHSRERRALADSAGTLLDGLKAPRPGAQASLWSVNLNRRARTALWRSRESIKADAATLLFDVSCRKLRWAIVDSGIDATHPAFGRRDDRGRLVAKPAGGAQPGDGTRVVATYDFTQLRPILAGQTVAPGADDLPEVQETLNRLRGGRAIDWDLLAPLLRVQHEPGYLPPTNEHGTHVAGIVGGDWRTTDAGMPVENDLRGVCPDIELYDLRVFDANGVGDEFSITAALQFIRHLNSHSDLQVIHGVNLSLSLDHDVRNYAVGRTPVCDECDRLVASGVVVVTVAGNEGRAEFTTSAGRTEGYRTVAITDPGNAEGVITVGATHRFQPHTYGVSYFSSRGPTGDGRIKPDLVAPGEKINSPVPGADYKAKDGTSQAAPHVSGAAALLMARYEELLGQPKRIKQILCATATDLGRERTFQGAGMVDALRAMQSV